MLLKINIIKPNITSALIKLEELATHYVCTRSFEIIEGEFKCL